MTDQAVSADKTGSPPFTTGGGGFDYHDRVAAYILAAMLFEQTPFDAETANVVKLDWETSVSGWGFDDLLMTCQNSREHRFAISCKSGRHVTAGGWPSDTAKRAWEHWVRTHANPFQRATDRLAVVASAIAQDAKEAWDKLHSESLVGESKRFMQLYQSAGTSSETGRALVESLKCPTELSSQVTNEPDQRFEIIRHLRLWILDVLATDSAAINRAIQWCRSALVSGDRMEAEQLFQVLIGLATDRRSRSGTLAKRELIELLTDRFTLKVAPSHEASWRSVDKHSEELSADIRTTVNDVLCLMHPDAWTHVFKAAQTGQVVVLEGESGSGKSALAKRLGLGRVRVLWLSAADLEQTTLTAVGTQLGSTVPLGTLVDEERSTDALLVIDGAERLTENGRRIAAKLVAIALKAAKPWTVAITTQKSGADALVQEIGKVSGEAPVQSVEVHLPDEEAVQEVVAALGVTLSAKATPSLLRALRNLKAMDWVARVTQKKNLNSFPDLVEQIWSGLVGTDNARARSEVLKKLGKEDAARVVGGVPSSALSSVGEQQVAETLIRDGLLSDRKQRLFFRHDLLGDWARLLVLIEAGENVGQLLRELSDSFRWGPAVRLYAEWLLQEGDEERKRLVSLIISQPPNPISLTLLEGLLRSPDCAPVLEAILDHPTWNTSNSLDVLLNTFASVGTRPSAITRAISKTHPDSASIRSTFRTPVLDLWPPVIAVMEKRTDLFAQRAPLRLGQVMRRWLADLSTVTRKDLVSTHIACSRLAVASARELQARLAESKYIPDDGVQHAFEAALYAAPWLPDDVASLARELASRRPQPQWVKDRVEAERQRTTEEIKARLAKVPAEELKRRQRSMLIGPRSYPKRPPLVDGPAERINEEFRKAVFAGGVLVRLMVSRPAAAQEVLLACCLQTSNDEDPLHSSRIRGDDTGTIDPLGWYPPLHLRGPWLVLLNQLPEQGLDAIMRLVEVATIEWLRLNIPPQGHAQHDWLVKVSTITLKIGGTERVFRGDNGVFGWYRDYGRAGNIVASALMALEAWLYSLIETNQPVEWIINRLLESSTSVAFLGVLAAVARKKHELLEGALRSLIQSWMVLDWDEQISGQALMPQVDLFGLRALNTFYDNEAERWSALPHRKHRLPWLIAQGLALGQSEIIQECAAARTIWQTDLDSGTCLSTETVQRFIALLDPKNLSLLRRPDGQVILSVEWPPQLQAKYDERGKEANASITGFKLRQIIRELLDTPRAITDEQAELFWKEAAALPDPAGADDQDGGNTAVDARAAVAAALENHASAWLDKFPDRRAWCEAAALAAIGDRAGMVSMARGMSIFKEYGESFAGAWAIARLAAGDNRKVIRRAVAEAMTAREHIVTGQVLAAAVRLAANMPGELERLFNLIWLWAALRNLPSGSWKLDSGQAKIAANRRQRLIDAYVMERISITAIPWDDLKLRAARVTERHWRIERAGQPQWRLSEEPASPPPLPSSWENFDTHGFNWSLLERVIDSLPCVVRPSIDPNLAPLIEFDRRLLDLACWTMKRAPRRRSSSSSDSYPEMLERLALDRAASVIAAHEDESVALGIWRILAPQLAPHHKWTEAFFDSWFAYGRKEKKQAERFHRRWQLMINHADTLPEWATADGAKKYDLGKSRSALLGVHERGSKLGVEEDRQFLASMVERYRIWAKENADDPWQLRSFCYFLQKPGAVDLRLPALSWVRDAWQSLPGYRATDKELVAEMVALCVTVWYQQSQAVLPNLEARSALIDIIQRLSNMQVLEIKELKADLEAAIAQNPADKDLRAPPGQQSAS